MVSYACFNDVAVCLGDRLYNSRDILLRTASGTWYLIFPQSLLQAACRIAFEHGCIVQVWSKQDLDKQAKLGQRVWNPLHTLSPGNLSADRSLSDADQHLGRALAVVVVRRLHLTTTVGLAAWVGSSVRILEFSDCFQLSR